MSEGLKFEDLTSASHVTNAHMDGDSHLSAGQMLKQARVNAGLHVAALAVTLKVPVKRLEALEGDNMALLPDIVFLRALASSVCRTLRVDPTPILEKLPKASSPRLSSQYDSINMPVRRVTPVSKLNFFEFLMAPWVIGVLLLLSGAATIYLWPKALSPASFETPATVSLSSIGVNSQVLKDVNPAEKLMPSVIAVNEASSVATPALSKETTLAVDKQSPTNSDAPASASVSDSFTLIATNTAVPANSIVVFKATGQTWVEVKSVNGITILKKLLNNGEVAGASGTLPLTVIVGRADVTQVEVRGKHVDLASIAKSNVARFEVN